MEPDLKDICRSLLSSEEQKVFQKEEWSSRCRGGATHRWDAACVLLGRLCGVYGQE